MNNDCISLVNGMTLFNGPQLNLGSSGTLLFSKIEKPTLFLMKPLENTRKQQTSNKNINEEQMICENEDSISFYQESILPISEDSAFSNENSQSNSHMNFSDSLKSRLIVNEKNAEKSLNQDIVTSIIDEISCHNINEHIKTEPLPQSLLFDFDNLEAITHSSSFMYDTGKEVQSNQSGFTIPNNQTTLIHQNTTTMLNSVHSSQVVLSNPNNGPTIDQLNSGLNFSSAINKEMPLNNHSNNVVYPPSNQGILTQASNINAMSEMTDNELLHFINPAAFDQSKIIQLIPLRNH